MSTRPTHVRARLASRDRLLITGTATPDEASRNDVYPVTYPSGAPRRAPVEGDEVGIFWCRSVATALAPER